MDVNAGALSSGCEYDYAIGADIDGTPRVIAEVFGRVAGTIRPPAKQTAALIAAAPDLYAALKAFVDCDAFMPNIVRQADDDEDFDNERRESIYRIAEAALAKATEALK